MTQCIHTTSMRWNGRRCERIGRHGPDGNLCRQHARMRETGNYYAAPAEPSAREAELVAAIDAIWDAEHIGEIEVEIDSARRVAHPEVER